MEALTTSSIAQLEHMANEVIAMEEKADELRRTVAIHRQRQQQRQHLMHLPTPAATFGELSLRDGLPVPGAGLSGGGSWTA